MRDAGGAGGGGKRGGKRRREGREEEKRGEGRGEEGREEEKRGGGVRRAPGWGWTLFVSVDVVVRVIRSIWVLAGGLSWSYLW